jgi:hypothetical protein
MSTAPILSSRSLLAVVILTGGACTPAHMAVPKDVSTASQEIVITDRSSMTGALANESFKMGPYQVADVNRKWNSSSSSGIAGFSSGKSRGGYAFAFKAAEGTYAGTCTSLLDEKSVSLFGGALGTQRFTVLCECAGPAKARCEMSADDSARYRGTVSTGGGGSYAIEGIYTDEKGKSTSSPLGYQVRGGESVGAVEVLNKGRVWLSRSLEAPRRAEVACLFAGLLLYQAPKSDL